MWHGVIHISDATTPWCALSGQAIIRADAPLNWSATQRFATRQKDRGNPPAGGQPH
ncbi:hypothetical protein ACFFJN_02305 [Erwinia mallotivora]|uniref:hypothetical protein n=1 Tax=Erwinia mallotivora TaxID=69222 RepID=UPI0035E58E96